MDHGKRCRIVIRCIWSRFSQRPDFTGPCSASYQVAKHIITSFSVTQRKHEGVERDLAALEDKVMTLGQEAARLCGIHPDHADQINAKHQEIVNNWERLTEKAKVILSRFF